MLDGDEFFFIFDMSLVILQMGSGQFVENLEFVLIGLLVQEYFVFQFEFDEVFGQYNLCLVECIVCSGLLVEMEFKENLVVEFIVFNGGMFVGFLCELDVMYVLFDFNYLMVGKMICFEVKIIGIM